jgi:hypothetical protein
MVDALPAGVESMAPGPELSALLSTVDRARLDASGVSALARARQRQRAHVDAQLLADALEIGLTAWATSDRMSDLDEFSADHVAFELTWSLSFAKSQLLLARDLIRRLPRVYEALSAGRVDLPRARVFSEVLSDVDDAGATALVDKLIDRAGEWTCGKLRDRLRYYLHKADPGLVSRRYRQAVINREVQAWTSQDGTASIFGKDLPVDRAAAADYLNRLARAAKAAGDVRTLAQLRADAYLDLLTGMAFCTQPNCDPITTRADEESRAWDQAQREQWPATWPTPPRESSTVDNESARGEEEEEQMVPASFVRDPADSIGIASLAAEWGRGGGAHLEPPPAEPAVKVSGTSSQIGGPPGSTAARDRAADAEQPPGDANPSDPDAGTGPPDLGSRTDHPPGGRSDIDIPGDEPPPDARQCCRCGGVRPGDRRGAVTITMTLKTLTGLTDDPAVIPGWGPVLAEIARNVALGQNATPSWQYAITDDRGRMLHSGPIRRRPTAEATRIARLRDRTCRAPHCRRTASECDTDHRKAYASGGASDHTNLDILCRRHHRLKHEKNLTLHPLGNGAYEWRAPNGQRWQVSADETGLLTADD